MGGKYLRLGKKRLFKEMDDVLPGQRFVVILRMIFLY